MKNLTKVLSLVMALAMLLGMCSFAVAEETTYSQSPVLDGEDLPAVAERLPVEADIMVEDMEEIGQYFNHMSFIASTSKWYPEKLTEEPLFRFKNDGTVEPNVAKGFDVNEDSTVWTIYLREGMKWSDGEPFTSEDCRFFYEDLLLTGVTQQSVWEAVQARDENGELQAAKMEIIDDYTFTMTFVASKPMFLEELAINGKWFFAPKHWLADKIPGENYCTDEEVEKLATDAGYSDSKAYLEDLTYRYWLYLGRPSLRPWVIQNSFDDALCIWTRNPYYWKTDAKGQQLPYADEIHFQRYSDVSQQLLWAMDGTSDMTIISWDDAITVMEKASADVVLKEWQAPGWSSQSLQFNLAIQDEDLRELFQNINFRHAISIAVNREQIVALVDKGYTQPAQSAPNVGQEGYDPEWTNKWTEYDPDGAKALLEECGLVLGSDGLWEFANGKDVVLNLQYTDTIHAPVIELLSQDLQNIGLTVTSRLYDRSIMDTMTSANTHEVVVNFEKFSTVSMALRPDYFIPFRPYPIYGYAFGQWYQDHDTGVEPPEDVKALQNLYDEMMASATREERLEKSLEILAHLRENMYEIGFTSALNTLYCVNANLHNFPETSVYCDEFRGEGIGHLQTWWISE